MYQEALKERLKPFISQTRCDVRQVEDEINCIAHIIKNAAEEFLPHFTLHLRKKHRFTDKILTQLSAKSKKAWKEWNDAGRPTSGHLYDAKCSLRAEVRK